MPRIHRESHRSERIGWLRAAVLGANDGAISTASLVVGVAAAGASHASLLATGIAGLVAGAMSMAAGEYVSVKSQADTEQADIEKESRELATQPEAELAELTAIYRNRGLEPALAEQVAAQMMARDALGAHARDELGITETLRARPIQAAFASALSFSAGALFPIVSAFLSPPEWIAQAVSATTLVALLVLGGVSAYAGGASIARSSVRVAFWGALAMASTAAIGALFGQHIS